MDRRESVGREADEARAGRLTRVRPRVDAFVEPQAIRALYTAAQAIVLIDPIIPIVRGQCALRPGVRAPADRRDRPPIAR